MNNLTTLSPVRFGHVTLRTDGLGKPEIQINPNQAPGRLDIDYQADGNVISGTNVGQVFPGGGKEKVRQLVLAAEAAVKKSMDAQYGPEGERFMSDTDFRRGFQHEIFSATHALLKGAKEAGKLYLGGIGIEFWLNEIAPGKKLNCYSGDGGRYVNSLPADSAAANPIWNGSEAGFEPDQK